MKRTNTTRPLDRVTRGSIDVRRWPYVEKDLVYV
jgi:hypothetical protein